MAVDSSSTLTQVQAQFDDNVGYARLASVEMAHLLVEAGRILLRRVPAESNSREGGIRFDPAEIRHAIEKAEEWIAANPPSSDTSATAVDRFTRVSFQNFRR